MARLRCLDLAEEYYRLGCSQALPLHLKEQFARASSSIALNLAECNAKSSLRDRLRIFEIAYGSFRESQTILRLVGAQNATLLRVGDQLGVCLCKLIDSLKIIIKNKKGGASEGSSFRFP